MEQLVQRLFVYVFTASRHLFYTRSLADDADGDWSRKFAEVSEPYESRLWSSLQKICVFLIGFQAGFAAMSVPKVVGVSSLSLDKLANSSDLFERMGHIEKKQLCFFGTDLSSANKGMHHFASPVLATDSFPEFFIVQQNVCMAF